MKNEYYHSKEKVQEYLRMSEGIDGAEHIEKFGKYLPKGSSVLELGSGPGKDWHILNKQYAVVGSDVSDEFLAHLHNIFPHGNFIKASAEKIETNKTFQGIYSNKVLHHLTDEELQQSVKCQLKILEQGGIICHTFWHGEGTEEYEGMFVNNHTKAELQEFFGYMFEILEIERYKEFEEDDSVLLIGRKR